MERFPLPRLAAYFARLGVIGFGGPPAHLGLMRRELVEQRGWLSSDEFNRHLATANLIPGPTSTEMTIYIGHHLRGVRGAIVAGASFIAPAFFIVLAISVAYVALGALPAFQGLLYGVKPIALALVVAGTISLGRSLVVGWRAWLIFLGAIGLVLVARFDVLVLFVLGGMAMLALSRVRGGLAELHGAALFFARQFGAQDLSLTAQVFLVFLKIGIVIYGGGFALVGILQQEVVVDRGWLTQSQFLDGIAIGQATPGPVFTTATFVGYVVAGYPGAVVATVAIFLPAFVFVIAESRLLGWLKNAEVARTFLRGVNAVVVATIAVAAAQLAPGALVDGLTVAVAAAAFIILMRYKIGAHWLVLGGLAIGVVHVLI